jgi:thiol-disulfide isomerase/thioredoxin
LWRIVSWIPSGAGFHRALNSKIEPGKVYVVEFWATWCGPCIAFMPHLAELQAQYKEKGVTIIGFSAWDPKNSEEQATAFVRKRGPGLKYTFAFAGDSMTFDAWMTAAGRSGIPCTFVVDKAGRIAYIGHPMYLGMVLPKVVAGNATARGVGDEMLKIESEFNAIITYDNIIRDPKAAFQAIKAFEAKYPPLADFFLAAKAKLSFLPKYGNPGEAKEYAEAVVAKAIKKGDVLMLDLASAILRRGDGKESQELLAVAVTAAEAIVRFDGGKHARSLIDLADAYFISGDKAKAKEYARKAIDAASGEPSALKESIEKEARRLGADR